jgi:hypothetical protein
MKKFVPGLLVILLAAFAPSIAHAAGAWQFAVTPYLWGAGFDGTVEVRGYEADVSKGFGDVVDNLDFAAMVNLRAKKERFGLYTDVTFLSLSDTTSVSGVAGVTLLEATTSIDQWMVEFGGSWEAARWANGAASGGSVDLYAGGRYWNLDPEISVGSPVLGGGRSVSKTLGWVDPVVGARVAADVTPKLQLLGSADVGGFDLGSGTSKFTWSASAFAGWHFTPLVSAYAGWKYLSVEREDSPGTRVDVAISGPALGVAFTF